MAKLLFFTRFWYNTGSKNKLNIMYEDILSQIGLSDEEVEIYQTLLKLGRVPASIVIEETSLKRGSVYNYLNDLEKKGLVKRVEGDKKLEFEPQSPDNLKSLIKDEKRRVDEVEKNLDNVLPSLKSKFNLTVEKPTIRHFEGIDGVKEVYKDTLETAKDLDEPIKVIVSDYDSKEFDEYLRRYYVPKRAKRGIKSKVISPTKPTKEKLEEDKKLLKERRYISREEFAVPTEIDIYNDKVALISFKEKLIGVIIENKDYAQTMNKIFDQMWEKLS